MHRAANVGLWPIADVEAGESAGPVLISAFEPKRPLSWSTHAMSSAQRGVIRFQAWLEVATGGTLAALAIVMFVNAHFCFVNQASCGMVEPIVGMYALALALPLLLAGWLHQSGRSTLGNLVYLPVIGIAFLLYGQAQSWW